MPPKWPFQASYQTPLPPPPPSPFTTVTFYSWLPHHETFLSKDTPQQEVAAPRGRTPLGEFVLCSFFFFVVFFLFLHHFLGTVREPQASPREKSKQDPAS